MALKIDNVYIISYMPDNETRQKRFEIHNKQLDYFIGIGLKPIIFSQNYHKCDFREGVKYINNDKNVLLPGEARNILLKEFYSSDNDIGWFCDNDTILYSGEKYCDSDNILEILRNLDNIANIDIFTGLNPTQSPFTEKFKTDESLKYSLEFKRKASIPGYMFFISNQPKEKQIFFNDWKDKSGKILMGEDVEFSIRAIKSGLNVYELQNIVMKDMGWNLSTWCKNPEHRKEEFKGLKSRILELGLELSSSGNINYKKFLDSYNIPRIVRLPKNVKSQLDEFFS